MVKRRAGDRHDAARVDLGRGLTAALRYLSGRDGSIAHCPFTVGAVAVSSHVRRFRRPPRRGLATCRQVDGPGGGPADA